MICDHCKVWLTGDHRHRKWCVHNWPNVRPSEWTREQKAAARQGLNALVCVNCGKPMSEHDELARCGVPG